MKKTWFSLAFAACVAGYTPVSMAMGPQQGGAVNDPNKVLAVVNGHNITQQEFNDFVGPAGDQMPPQQRNAMLNDMISRTLVLQSAVKEGVDKDPEFVAEFEKRQAKMLETLKLNTLFEFGIQKHLQNHPVSDAQLKEEYAKFTPIAQYQLRHILVKSEADAKSMLEQLKKGADFGQLAMQNSMDMSRQWGGNLGWLAKDQMFPEIAAKVTAMKKGQLAPEVVKTQAGWHVLFLADTRELKPLDFDAAKPQLTGQIQGRMTGEYLEQLRAQGKVQINQQ